MILRPNSNTRKEELLALLDAHCREENWKILAGANAIFSEFNFLYLPIDFVTENNLGYAFVNFTSSTGADCLYRFLHHRNWAAYSSRKNWIGFFIASLQQHRIYMLQ